MAQGPTCDEELLRRLPLPLAQLYRRAHNAKAALEQHLTALYLSEAALKLLASVAVAEYAGRGGNDPAVAERLTSLARPSLGHWWEYVRLLVPALADAGDPGFGEVRDLLLGRARDDLPRAAGLDALLSQELEGRGGARATVRLTELFDRLVTYRNKGIAHAAPGQRPDDFHERLAGGLLAGLAEVLGRLDVLAGRRLVYVGEVRQVGGVWLVQRFELTGESARRIASLELPREQAARLPDGERVYLASAPASARSEDEAERARELRSLHPLLLYDAGAEEVLFLNARRGRQRTEYLCYTSGRTDDRADLGGEQRALLARVLGMAVAEDQAEQWAASAGDAGPVGEPEQPGPARRLLGEFELLSELGRGGMGVVYRAWQPSLSRQVALKCLRQSGDTRAEARFRREIRALGKVEHPNLVKVFTSASEGDEWFYAMELVEGATLAAVYDRLQTRVGSVTELDLPAWRETLGAAQAAARQAEKPLSDPSVSRGRPPPEHPPAADAPGELGTTAGRGYVRHVVELVRQVALAAHALHEANVIHRDINPGNIMVGADGERAFLMDLGLAQLADDVEGRVTRTRQFVGTLRYASPEQVLAVGGLDRRSDVYSLGATLWELLALRPLYGATDQTPSPELMRRIQYEEPQRLRQRHPGLARDLEAVAHKCLEKDPNKRYATAQELARDLQRFLDGKPVRARRVGRVERGWKWVRRHPWQAGLAAAAVALVLLLVAAGVAAFFDSEVRGLNGKLQAALTDKEQLNEGLKAALSDAEGQRDEAHKQRREAEKQKAEADNQRELVRRAFYAAQIRLADLAAQQNRIADLRQILEPYQPVPGDDPNKDLRGFEWDSLWRLCEGDLPPLRGHTGQIRALAFSPAGRLLASGGDDGTVRLWDPATGDLVRLLRNPAGWVLSVAFSPDGRLLACGSEDGAVRLSDAATGQEAHVLKGHAGWVRSVAFSGDSGLLATGGSDGMVRLWDVGAWKQVHVFQEQAQRVTSVVFCPGTGLLASCGDDGVVRLLDVVAKKEVRTFAGHTGWVLSVAFSPDGRLLASGGNDGTARLWDVTTGKEVRALPAQGGRLNGVAFSPDGRLLACASENRLVRLWDAASGKEVRALEGYAGPVTAVAFSADGRLLASSVGDGTVRLRDAASGPEGRTVEGDAGRVTGVAFSRDSRMLASCSWDETVLLWDAASGERLQAFVGHAGPVRSVAFSSDGRFLASGGDDGAVRLWDSTDPKQDRTLKGHSGRVTAVAFSPNGQLLASGDGDGAARLWNVATGETVHALQGHAGGITSVAFGPDGRLLACGGEDGTVLLWETATGEQQPAVQGNQGEVTGLAFSPAGRLLASGSDKGTVRLWHMADGKEVRVLRGHGGPLRGLAFSPDGRLVAAGSADGAALLWDAATGQELRVLPGVGGRISSVAFSPDGQHLAAGSDGKVVAVWDGQRVRADIAKRAVGWRRQQAVACERDEDWFAAAFHLGRLEKEDPADASSPKRLAYSLGRFHDGSGKWDNAIADYNEAIRLDARYAAAYRGRAAAWRAGGDQEKAGADYAEALRLNPDYAKSFVESGSAWYAKKEYDKAIAEYEEAIRLDPKYAPAYRARGEACKARGDDDKAADDYAEAHRLDPKYARTFLASGVAWYGKKEYEKAIADYTQAIRLDPKNGEAHRNRAEAFYFKLDYEKAIADYTEAIRLDPEDAKAYRWRGNACYTKEDYDKAIADYTEAIHLDPKDAATHNWRGDCWKQKRDYDKAITDYTEAIDLDPANAKWHRDRGDAWYFKDEYDKAIADYTEAIRLEPMNAGAYSDRGRAWYAKKEDDKAIADYDKAIDLDSKDAGTYRMRGNAWYNKEAYDKAIADYYEAILLEPKSADTYRYRGSAYYGKEDYDNAIIDYTKAIRLEPKDAYAHRNRGGLFYLKRDYDKAIADYTEAIRLDPEDAETYRYRGSAWRAKKDYEKALADYTLAIERDAKDSLALADRAWLLATCPDARYRDAKRAVDSAKQACELSSWKEPNNLDILAAAFAEAGEFDQAIKQEKKALEDPAFAKTFGEGARKRLKLYEGHKPYRDE
jgi:WD40 repeat protein/tetratricopeptide (TPR) repeat protein/serine/threonine protein kinase